MAKKKRKECGPIYSHSTVNGKRVYSDKHHRFLHAVGVGHWHVMTDGKGHITRKKARVKRPRRSC